MPSIYQEYSLFVYETTWILPPYLHLGIWHTYQNQIKQVVVWNKKPVTGYEICFRHQPCKKHKWVLFPVKLSPLCKSHLEVDWSLIWTSQLLSKYEVELLWHMKKFPFSAVVEVHNEPCVKHVSETGSITLRMNFLRATTRTAWTPISMHRHLVYFFRHRIIDRSNEMDMDLLDHPPWGGPWFLDLVYHRSRPGS